MNMAKSQKRTTREVRKPKASKTKASAPVGLEASPVLAATRKPQDKR
jgi:hypothetical protein